jgi:hypothetical protein
VTNRKRIKLIFLVFFGLLSTGLYAQQLDLWFKSADKDKFGDATGKYNTLYFTKGNGVGSRGKKSPQIVGINYQPHNRNAVFISFKPINEYELNLDMFIWGTPQVTLYIKDSAGKTYEFHGLEAEALGLLGVVFINNTELIALLRNPGTYRAVVDGGDRDWSCSFTFEGGMPE